jgi:two-component system LytT family sensor kinase
MPTADNSDRTAPSMPVGPSRAEPGLGAIVLTWSIFAWYTAFSIWLAAYINRTPYPSWRAVVPALAEWYLWVPLTAVILNLARRYPLVRPWRWRALAIHGVAVCGVSAIRGAVYTAASVLVAPMPPPVPLLAYFWRVVVGYLPIAAALYGAIVAVQAAMAFAGQARADELRAARLETQLARAKFAVLRSNVHPHFLFNALHSVGALVRVRDHDGAIRMIAELSDLLRSVLRRDAPDEVPLHEELALVERYLEIERVRFRDRLNIHWDIAPDVTSALVPRLFLQPLAENAIRHGIGRSSAAGRVTITAVRVGTWLEVGVADDGPGPAQGGDSKGTGLATTRARLQHAYGPGADVTLSHGAEGGAVTIARLPFSHA